MRGTYRFGVSNHPRVHSSIAHRRLLGSLLAVSLSFPACGGEDASPDGSGGAPAGTGGNLNDATGGATGSGGSGGADAATGGASGGNVATGGVSASGGASPAGGGSTGNSGGAEMGSGGAEMGSGGDTAGSGGEPAGSGGAENIGPFQCNQWTGGALMNELYGVGFENQFAGARWQLKWLNSAQVQNWEDPNSDWWKAPITSACENGSASPDHVVFMVFSWDLKAEADWYTSLGSTVSTFINQYPDLRRLDLMYQITGPDNTLCPPDPAPETIVVSPELEAAMEQVAADHPGLVYLAPRWAASSCADFVGGGPHLTTDGNTAALTNIVDYLLPDLE